MYEKYITINDNPRCYYGRNDCCVSYKFKGTFPECFINFKNFTVLNSKYITILFKY